MESSASADSTSPANARAYVEHLREQVKRYPGRAGVVTVIEHNTPPDTQSRQILIRGYAELKSVNLDAAFVIRAGGFFAGAARALREAGLLYLYGPYSVQGKHTAPSNADFDSALRAQNPEWGIRDLENVEQLAREHGFDLAETIAMPANNFSVLFRKR